MSWSAPPSNDSRPRASTPDGALSVPCGAKPFTVPASIGLAIRHRGNDEKHRDQLSIGANQTNHHIRMCIIVVSESHGAASPCADFEAGSIDPGWLQCIHLQFVDEACAIDFKPLR
jgi:hypothetical protein